jgi:hypothetical protein
MKSVSNPLTIIALFAALAAILYKARGLFTEPAKEKPGV